MALDFVPLIQGQYLGHCLELHKPLEMISKKGIRLLMQSLVQVLDMTPTINDNNFVKYVIYRS